ELPGVVGRERDPGLDQVVEAAGAQGGLGQGVVAVHRAAAEQRLGHRAHRVRLAAGERERVVRLLVRARVAGGAGADLVRGHHDVGGAEAGQPHGGVVAGRAGPDDEARGGDDGYLLVADGDVVQV